MCIRDRYENQLQQLRPKYAISPDSLTKTLELAKQSGLDRETAIQDLIDNTPKLLNNANKINNLANKVWDKLKELSGSEEGSLDFTKLKEKFENLGHKVVEGLDNFSNYFMLKDGSLIDIGKNEHLETLDYAGLFDLKNAADPFVKSLKDNDLIRIYRAKSRGVNTPDMIGIEINKDLSNATISAIRKKILIEHPDAEIRFDAGIDHGGRDVLKQFLNKIKQFNEDTEGSLNFDKLKNTGSDLIDIGAEKLQELKDLSLIHI